VLFFFISLRRSRGEESREEKSIAGPSSVSVEEEDGVGDDTETVGSLEAVFGEEDSRREA